MPSSQTRREAGADGGPSVRSEVLYKTVLVLLIALAFGIRLGYVVAHPDPPIFDDALHYDDIAKNLAAGNGFSMSYEYLLEGDRPADGGSAATARRPPLYPLYLAAFYATLGQNYAVVLVAQAFLGTLFCFLVFLLARATDGRPVALLALGLCAVHPSFVRYCGLLLTETMFLVLTVGAFLAGYLAIERGGFWRSALAGALGALATLCRPTAMFFLPLHICLVWIGHRWWRGRDAGIVGEASADRVGARKKKRSWRREAGAYAVIFCLILAPWVVRNLVVFDAFIPGFTSSGYNLFMGTFPPSRGLSNMDPRLHPPELRNELTGKGEVESDRIFRRAAFRNVVETPGAYAKLVGMKLIRTWFVIKPEHTWRPSPRSLAVHVPLLTLALVGVFLLWKTRPLSAVLLSAGVVSFTAFHALVVSNLRYNLPAVPFAIVLAAYAVAFIGRKMLRR
jgi:hypothetical protein